MPPEMNEELQQAIDAEPGSPLRVIDPRTKKAYVLVDAEKYDRIRALLGRDDNLSDTYPAQMESAMRAGWADPAMSEYDRYDEHRRTSR